jgi:predicted metalloprotease
VTSYYPPPGPPYPGLPPGPPYPGPPPGPPYPGPPPAPPPRRDTVRILLGVGIPVLALLLIGVVIVVVTRSAASPGWLGTLTQVVRVDASVEAYWSTTLPREFGVEFRPARVEHFNGRPLSSCDRPAGAVQAFYCPRDEAIFISTGLYDDIGESLIDADAAAFARAVLLAHEYGHHIQSLIGTVRRSDDTGSDVARMELQADCFAGLWAHAVWRADTTVPDPLEQSPRSNDIELMFLLIGDPDPWDPADSTARGEIHGSAEQREAWFRSGFVDGSRAACDTGSRVDPEGFPL